jgi:hypothetical protein
LLRTTLASVLREHQPGEVTDYFAPQPAVSAAIEPRVADNPFSGRMKILFTSSGIVARFSQNFGHTPLFLRYYSESPRREGFLFRDVPGLKGREIHEL